MAQAATAAMAAAGIDRTGGPVGVVVEVVVAIPKSYRGKQRLDALTGMSWPSGDVDNYVKAALDGASVLWDDDRQVVQMAATKRWGGGWEEGLALEVVYLAGEPVTA